jgi:hypothetical protein
MEIVFSEDVARLAFSSMRDQRPFPVSPWRFWTLLCATAIMECSGLPAFAFSTGQPLSFSIDPATVRQREADTSPVEALIVLKEPSPTFFICQIRSFDKDKISFPNVIFRKGDLKGKSEGLVHWKFVLTDCRVRISVFNVDAPDQQLSFTVTLKPASAPAEPQSVEPSP